MLRLTAVTVGNVLNRMPAAVATNARCASHGGGKFDWQQRIGNREVVGYGLNGSAVYYDHPGSPFPSIRYKEDSAEFKALREKEKGDWSKLSIDEKKTLYRSNFGQTFAEMHAPDHQWRSSVGLGLMVLGMGCFVFVIMRHLTHHEFPETYGQERSEAQLRRMLDLEMNPIDGLSSKWDYTNDKWK